MKKLVNDEDLINWWLKKYHNTNLEQVKKDHPEWLEKPAEHTRDFYAAYMVTQEQHDEWEKWAKEYTKKVTGLSKAFIDRSWWTVYLNISPQIIKT
jgi:hypothetical protein